MIVGFTGTRKGMNSSQEDRLRGLLSDWQRLWPDHQIFVHGGADGADTQAHAIAVELGYGVEVRPTPENMVNWINRLDVAVVHPPKPPLDRNLDIVSQCEVLVATPYEREEIMRSGTWATVRAARKQSKHYAILRGTH